MARKNNQDDDASELNRNDNDDTFGLPEIEYQPIKRDETTSQTPRESNPNPINQNQQMESEQPQYNEYNTNYYEEENNSPWPKILAIAAIIFLGAVAIWYFGMYRPGQNELAEKQRIEREAEEAKRREDALAENRRLEDERRRADSLAAIATPTTGVIDTLTERTGRYYVIIASGVDGDLILDYAKKLTPKGLSPKIIPPHGKVKFYRLAIEEGDTYASTQARADELKSEYTNEVWVVKY